MKKCPRCGKNYIYPAISRKDNKTPICPDCGMREAIEAYHKHEIEQAEKANKK